MTLYYFDGYAIRAESGENLRAHPDKHNPGRYILNLAALDDEACLTTAFTTFEACRADQIFALNELIGHCHKELEILKASTFEEYNERRLVASL